MRGLFHDAAGDLYRTFKAVQRGDGTADPAFKEEFDHRLEGRMSALVSYDESAETIVADAYRLAMGYSRDQVGDDEALRRILDPALNPYRLDKRAPCVGEHQLHMNPATARDLGINDGDYVYVDANPADRPYLNAKPDDPFYKVARCMLRVKYNHAYPYNIVMMKHAPFIATEKSVKAHETRPDGRALSENTGYQANLRYGSQQSITRNWHMPMHQTDTLFHKTKAYMGFIFGGESDNHAVNTVPKETLVRVSKAEDGGMGGKGIWKPATTGYTPDNESEIMTLYLAGDLTK